MTNCPTAFCKSAIGEAPPKVLISMAMRCLSRSAPMSDLSAPRSIARVRLPMGKVRGSSVIVQPSFHQRGTNDVMVAIQSGHRDDLLILMLCASNYTISGCTENRNSLGLSLQTKSLKEPAVCDSNPTFPSRPTRTCPTIPDVGGVAGGE